MSNQSEIVERREDVMTSLLRGWRTADIIKATTTNYNVSKVTIERDITHCYAEIRKKYEREIPDIISNHIAKYEEIHRAAMELGDFRSCIAALQAIEKLLKLHVEQPLIAIQNNTVNLDNLSLHELQELLSETN